MNKLKPEDVRRELMRAEGEHLFACAQYEAYKDRIKRLCSHSWSYVPDPSGNNDSCWYCDACGRWSRKPSWR